MQTYKNGDPIKVYNLYNYVQICWEIVIDLVLHERNKEKQTIFCIVPQEQ